MFVSTITLIIFSSLAILGFIYTYFCRYGDKKTFYKRVPLILVNTAMLLALSFFGTLAFHQYFPIKWPGLTAFVLQFVFIMFCDDMLFYFWHRFLHKNKTMLRRVHRIHHKAHIPFPMDFIYAHPLEWMGGTLGIIFAFAIIIMLDNSVSAYIVWCYAFYRTARELNIHSNTPVKLLKYFPFLCNTRHHTLHHSMARGNYASTFTYLDKLFGTEIEVPVVHTEHDIAASPR